MLFLPCIQRLPQKLIQLKVGFSGPLTETAPEITVNFKVKRS